MDANQWKKLSREEKFEARFAEWMSAPIPFASPEAAAAFKERCQMWKDVVQLKKPARIPITVLVGISPFGHAGITTEDGMYDWDKLRYAFTKFNQDFVTDSVISCLLTGSGPLFETLEYKLYQWPGHGVDPKASYQALEGEYMHADEYDLLINNPSDYFQRFYLPRVFGALQAWSMMGPFTDVIELPFTGGFMVAVGTPPLQEAFEKFLAAGRAALDWGIAAVGVDGASIASLGLPPFIAGYTKAPFDTLGDTMRGTRAIMLDKFRQPDKVLAAMERLTPLNIEAGVRVATANKGPFVFIPLHKGADGFLSDQDFRKFYWPSLKAVIIGLVNEGLVPFLFVEGGYNQRLDVIARDADIPAGSTFWVFDKTDMVEVKKHWGGWAAFGGNVPAAALATGTAQSVEAYVKKLIEDVAGDGGFALAPGAVLDHIKAENMHAMIDTCRKYGVY